MSINDRNRAIVKNLYEEVLNRRDMGSLGEFVSNDFQGPNGSTGPAGFRIPIETVLVAYGRNRFTPSSCVPFFPVINYIALDHDTSHPLFPFWGDEVFQAEKKYHYEGYRFFNTLKHLIGNESVLCHLKVTTNRSDTDEIFSNHSYTCYPNLPPGLRVRRKSGTQQKAGPYSHRCRPTG